MQAPLHALLRFGVPGAALSLAACGGGSSTGTGGSTGMESGAALASGTSAAAAGTGSATLEAAQRLSPRRPHGFPANRKPIAVARITGASAMQTATVFDTSGSRDPDGSIVSRSWAYGDGESGTQDTHVYKQPGFYVAVLTVTDDQGATASAAVPVTVAKCSAAGTAAAAATTRPTVCVQTSKGEMVAELYPTEAPVTVANFLAYVDEGFYAGTLFHRVIPGFMIQAGGYTSGLRYRVPTHNPIVLESNNGLKNLRYTLSMARTNDPNSATSQFFINHVDNPGLDYYSRADGKPNGYAVFGKVIWGTSVVHQIAFVPTTAISDVMKNVPLTEVVIRSAVRLP
jgi:peptidyl-prolyl cis-trans isomerase A (cyclophilin A)